MAEFDVGKFVNTPIDAFDFQFLIGDVEGYLEFSESNIDWQYQRELQAISHRRDLGDYPHEYRRHLEENAAHRFKVSLPLSVRYGALVAFTTSVEWAVGCLNRSASNPIPDCKNHTVKVIRAFAARAAVDTGGVVEDYEALVQIRNCVAHSAGIVATYRHKEDLPKAVARIAGISLGDWNFLGEQICIERGALDPYIEKTSRLIVGLHAAMRKKGLLREA